MRDSGKTIAFGEYALDFGSGELLSGQDPVDIQPTPLRLLLYLAEKSVAEHEPGMELFGGDPIIDPIRDSARFRALIERMGLTAYYEKNGVFERAWQRVATSVHNNEAAQ
jgi:hypothetical protein